MKKYVALILTSVFLIATFSIYYIHTALAKNDKTQFFIEHVDGDKGLLKDISVNGGYHHGNIYEPITITDKETSYASDLPFFEKIDYRSRPSGNKQFEGLKKKYPSFMRGMLYERYFFEDDTQIIYAEVDYSNSYNGTLKDLRFSIKTLDKEKKQTNSYTIDIPKQKDIFQMEVFDVQYLYDEVRIITSNQQSNPNVTEVRQYTINLKKNQITDDKIIYTKNDTANDFYSTLFITERNALQPSDIGIFQIEEIQVNDDGETTQSKRKMYTYHYKDAKLSELTLPAELLDTTEADISYMYDQEYLYANLSTSDEDKLKGTVYKIDLTTGEIADTLSLTASDNLQVDWINLNEDSIQLFGIDSEGHPVFAIYTLEEGKLLFEGRIMAKDSNAVNFRDLDISLDVITGI